jgi:23S rRNA (adenine2030-N6)-methyltransferase
VTLLDRVTASARRIAYVESHAGEGRYPLGPTGEWTEGIGRLWTFAGDDAPARYVALCRQLGAGDDRPRAYPGSPALARAVLPEDAELLLWERDPAAFARLEAHVAGDRRVRAVLGDGLRALPDALAAAEERADAVVALVDPSWTQRSDWTDVPDALAAAVAASRRACVVLWYPVKSLGRPNAMIARLAGKGVRGVAAELVTTPLEQRRHRLNGSGLLLVRTPADVLPAIAAAAPVLGAHCATRPGDWSFRLRAWGV